MQNPAIILCRYKLAPTPPCAQTHILPTATLFYSLYGMSWRSLTGAAVTWQGCATRTHHLTEELYTCVRLSSCLRHRSPMSLHHKMMALNHRQSLVEFSHAVTSLLQKFSSL